MMVTQGVVKLLLEALSSAAPRPLAPVLLIDVANVKQQQQRPPRPGPAPHSPPRSCDGKLRAQREHSNTRKHMQRTTVTLCSVLSIVLQLTDTK